MKCFPTETSRLPCVCLHATQASALVEECGAVLKSSSGMSDVWLQA